MNKYKLELLLSLYSKYEDATRRYCRYSGSHIVDAYLNEKRHHINRELNAAVDEYATLWSGRLGVEVSRSNAFLLSLLSSDLSLAGTDLLIRHLRGGSGLQEDVGDAFMEWSQDIATKTQNHSHFPISLSDFDYVVADGEYVTSDTVTYCDHCDEYHKNEDFFSAVVSMTSTNRLHYEDVCGAVDTFYCNASRETYVSSEFDEAEDETGSSVCRQWCVYAGWYYDDAAEQWSEYPPESNIPDYHDGDRTGIRAVVSRMQHEILLDRRERRYGVEMEVEFGCSSDRQSFFDEYVGTNAACMERDGSLNDECGFEIISPPIKLSEHRAGTWFSEMLQSARTDYGATAWRHRANYGCHVNVDLRGVTDAQVALFVALVNNMSALYSMVSGRKRVYNGTYKCIGRFDPTQSHRFYGVDYEIDLTDKYQPVRVANIGSPSSRFAEVRTFGANLRPNAMLEYIELVDATLCYAQYLSTLPYQMELFGEVPLTAYPVAEAFNQSVVGFLNWLPSEYTAFRQFLAHHNVPMDERADEFLEDKVAAL